MGTSKRERAKGREAGNAQQEQHGGSLTGTRKTPSTGAKRWLHSAPRLIPIVVMLCIGLLAVTRPAIPCPGPLSGSHAGIEDLSGVFGCVACHGGPTGSMAEACRDCHEEIAEQLDGARGFHRNITAMDVAQCDRCHAEHFGTSSGLVTDRSFALAGFESREAFEHQGLDFKLQGKHKELDCSKCHEHADNHALEEGQHRFLGQTQSCETCHEDPHEGKLEGCASCHGQSMAFELVAEFEHDKRFALTGGHDKVACKSCHEKDTSKSVEDLKSFVERHGLEDSEIRFCGTCHESPHSAGFKERTAVQLGRSTEATCNECHNHEGGSFLGDEATMTRLHHEATGFPILWQHRDVSCDKCHEGIGERVASETAPERKADFTDFYRGRDMMDCAACHGEPHEGQFSNGPYREAHCMDCHNGVGFVPSNFSLEQHAETAFPLFGAHRSVECAKCHQREDPEAKSGTRIFTGTSKDCESCHEHPHEGQFTAGAFGDRDCLVCHDNEGFAPSRFTHGLHERTRFPLDGAHVAVACDRCHTQSFASEKRIFTGTTMICGNCHQDVHDSAFDRPDLPLHIEGRAGCARCHGGTTSFRPVDKKRFDHSIWTKFELRGKHAETECVKCHERSGETTGQTPSKVELVLKVGTRCGTCHEDPHAGQFRDRKTELVDCTKCHVDDRPFEEHGFDHSEHSRFQLDADHAELDCAKCHKKHKTPNGLEITRYKPLGVECKDCHGVFVPESKKPGFGVMPDKRHIWRGRR